MKQKALESNAWVLSWILSIAIVAVAVWPSAAEGRSLPSSELKDLWWIEVPNTTYDPSTDTFAIAYTLHDDISVSDNVRSDIVDRNCDYPALSTPFEGILIDSMSTDAQHTIQLDNPRVGRNPNFLITETAEEIKIKFCTRFMLWTGPQSDPNAVEINYLETIIELTFDLTVGFATSVILRKPPKPDNKLFIVEDYEVESYICDPVTKEPIILEVIQQGFYFSLCYKASEPAIRSGLMIKELVDFVWTKPTESSVITEVVVENGVWLSPGLSNEECSPDRLVCVFSSLILAKFFYSSGILTGSGGIVYGFSRRRSLEERVLQGTGDPSDQGSRFMINIKVVPAIERPALAVTAGVAPAFSSTMAAASAIGICLEFLISTVLAA